MLALDKNNTENYRKMQSKDTVNQTTNEKREGLLCQEEIICAQQKNCVGFNNFPDEVGLESFHRCIF